MHLKHFVTKLSPTYNFYEVCIPPYGLTHFSQNHYPFRHSTMALFGCRIMHAPLSSRLCFIYSFEASRRQMSPLIIQ